MGHVGYNAADSRYRGRGIGTMLVEKVLEIFREGGHEVRHGVHLVR